MSLSLRCVGLTLLAFAAGAEAQTQYVTDSFVVELRRGPSLEYLILRNVQSGEAVEVLEENAESGYSRVRIANGTEGWMLTRFLQAEPIARVRLAAADRNLAAARDRVAELETQVADLAARLDSADTELEAAQGGRDAASAELAEIRTASANVVELRDQNESLRQRLADSESAVEKLTVDNAALARRDYQRWFIVGAGVLLAGIVMGLIAPSLRRRRRTDW